MDLTGTLKRFSEYGGPVVLGGGMTMLAVALIGPPGASGVNAAPAPTPTVTVTAQPSPTPVPEPHPSATLVVQRQPVTFSQPAPRAPGQAGTSTSGNGSAEQPPRPPRRAAPSSGCTGVLAVQLPLGVLPDCALTLGGNR